MEDVVCLFHGDCFDGMGAAWTVKRKYPNAKFIPVEYQKVPPVEELLGKSVLIVDFSYSIHWLTYIAVAAKSLVIYDHHKSAENDLRMYNDWVKTERPDLTERFHAVYDVARSGALITWNELFPNADAPRLIQHISDRDLWNNVLPETVEIMAGVGTYPLDLAVWNAVFPYYYRGHFDIEHDDLMSELAMVGRHILRKQQIDIDRLIKLTKREITIGEHTVEMINVPRHLVSEAVGQLAKGAPFAVGYFDTAEGREFSFRSTKGEGLDVSKVAALFGGGGHANAAGARVPRDHPLAQI